MARKSIEKAILDMATDIRVQALSWDACGIWFRIMCLIREIGLDGSVTFGFGCAPSLADVARLRFGMTETELKTHLETHCKTQLLAWDDATQTLSYGPDQQPSRQTLANRANGAKGGRPPKNRITERTDPTQRHLPPMAIKGGKSVTESKTHAPIAKAKADNDSYHTAKLADPSAAEIDAVYNRIGPKAFDAAGFDPARSLQNWSAARQWAADGLRKGLTADEIERVVVAEVTRIAERQRSKGKPAPHLGYFGKAVCLAIASGAVPEAPKTFAQQVAEREWEEAMRNWVRDGGKGPQPVIADYLAKSAA
ncbi:hypothetical protein [Acetobacter persici]|uniref:Uncharacterized protein n=1 Tax=Acetobacter persici TaxID=1076596 RepID=A0A6V8IAZ8_9PROT|nr:hypothetical protein [Acetobacter persici]GFE94798.1 hypothetical protein DmAi_28570 [Acetobacter persici]